MDTETKSEGRAVPWNKGKLLGQKPPLKPKEIWAIRIRLQLTHRHRELALFNLAIDQRFARLGSPNFERLLCRVLLIAVATTSNVCCALRPVIPDASFLRHEGP